MNTTTTIPVSFQLRPQQPVKLPRVTCVTLRVANIFYTGSTNLVPLQVAAGSTDPVVQARFLRTLLEEPTASADYMFDFEPIVYAAKLPVIGHRFPVTFQDNASRLGATVTEAY